MSTTQKPDVLTPEQIEEIQARVKAATKGEWYLTHGHIENRDGESITLFHWPNAIFIANAKQDVPALCASHEALRKQAESDYEWASGIDAHWDELDVLVTNAGYAEQAPCDKYSVIFDGVRDLIKERDTLRDEVKRLEHRECLSTISLSQAIEERNHLRAEVQQLKLDLHSAESLHRSKLLAEIEQYAKDNFPNGSLTIRTLVEDFEEGDKCRLPSSVKPQ